jgi:arylformamidase
MELLGRTVIDLTHPLHPRMPVAIGFPRLMLQRYLDQDQGDVATVEILQAGLHTGTHVDAPMHFVPGAPTVDALDPLALSGSALLVDVPPTEGWVAVGPDELRAWERRTGERIGAGDIVLLRTGHARWWRDLPDGSRYLLEPWPYLTGEAADLLVERGIRALGVECADPDKVDQRDLASASFETHKRLLGAGIPIIENLANLDAIPVIRFDLLALALPIRGASASPIRALALVAG